MTKQTDQVTVGDSVRVLASWPENSVDAVVTDPPYELGFMGKSWDSTGIAYSVDLWRAVLRVMKPGAHLLAFGGTRTYHRMACAIEDAGFEIRDQAQWVYGQGFPKSLDVSKAIDKMNGDKRPVVGKRTDGVGNTAKSIHKADGFAASRTKEFAVTSAASAASAAWEGWGTALKPANEPICLARKPLSEATVAANVLKWGTGALNIEAARIDFKSAADETEAKDKNRHADFGSGPRENRILGADNRDRGASGNYDPSGRWPANLLVDQYAAGFLDAQEPGCSKVFYVPKPDGGERNAGLEDSGKRKRDEGRKAGNPGGDNPRNRGVHAVANFHPTVKPVSLMSYLVQMVTPPGGTVLDPFTGSGTTGIAAARLGFPFLGVELSEEYAAIARARIAAEAEQGRLL